MATESTAERCDKIIQERKDKEINRVARALQRIGVEDAVLHVGKDKRGTRHVIVQVPGIGPFEVIHNCDVPDDSWLDEHLLYALVEHREMYVKYVEYRKPKQPKRRWWNRNRGG